MRAQHIRQSTLCGSERGWVMGMRALRKRQAEKGVNCKRKRYKGESKIIPAKVFVKN